MVKKLVLILIFILMPGYLQAYQVIDGDSLKRNGKIYRLHGIDAPELDQTCLQNNLIIQCGRISQQYLKKLNDTYHLLCVKKGKDIYKRHIVTCYANYKDVGSLMVQDGMAMAYKKYSNKYTDDENHAKKNNHGIWQTKFISPWLWRKQNKKTKWRYK